MPYATRYLLLISMDIPPDKEQLFNEVYETEHVPNLMQVPGVRSVCRCAKRDATMNIGAQLIPVNGDGEPSYLVIYELDDPAVVTSDTWASALRKGRWPTEVSPHTVNRHVVMHEILRQWQ